VEFVQSMMNVSKVIGGTFLVLILMVFGTVAGNLRFPRTPSL